MFRSDRDDPRCYGDEMSQSFRVTHDPTVDAAYLCLTGVIRPGEATRTLPVTDDIILDFDADGHLIGIELLSGALLHPKLFAEAEKL
jgi:uncharacterized protein YuzE